MYVFHFPTTLTEIDSMSIPEGPRSAISEKLNQTSLPTGQVGYLKHTHIAYVDPQDHSLWLFLYLIHSAVCVSVLGKEFTQGCVVCLRAPSDEELPVFGLVEYILVSDDLKYLVVRQYSTDY